MTEADKIFEELGYKKSEDEEEICYKYNEQIIDGYYIDFNKEEKTVKCYCYTGLEPGYIEPDDFELTPNEIYAIYLKIKEEGWL